MNAALKLRSILLALLMASATVAVASGQAPVKPQTNAISNAAVTGTWYAIANTYGSPIELKADGSYLFGGQQGGRYKVTASGINFTGSLASWNNGQSTLKNGVMEFYWTNASGAQNYFAYSR